MRPRYIPFVRSVACAIALAALAGWALRVEWLVTWGGRTEMVPNTALSVCFLYIATWVRAHRRRRDATLMISDGCAIGVVLMSLLVLCPVPAVAHALDLVLLPYAPRVNSGVLAPGHISPGTALALIALCIGLIVRVRWWRRAWSRAALVSLVAGYLGGFAGVTSLPTLVSVGLMAIAAHEERRYV